MLRCTKQEMFQLGFAAGLAAEKELFFCVYLMAGLI